MPDVGLRLDQQPGSTVTVHRAGGADGALGTVRRTVLADGTRVISEQMSGVRSVSVGVWVGVGSRDEGPTLAGATHFLEHLLFKRTGTRSAEQIAGPIEAGGGELNAFTTKEYTCYYAHLLDVDLPLAVEVLGDMVSDSLLHPDDVASERAVVLEEIAMHDDEPADAVHELVSAAVWGDAPLGRPVAGTAASVQALSTAQLRRWYRTRYRGPNLVVAAAGNLEHRELVRLVRSSFTDRRAVGAASPNPPRRSAATRRRPASSAGATSLLTRKTEQANLIVAVPGLRRTDERRFVLAALNAVLGGGMASRLFQEVRERRGLAYSVYSFVTGYADTGMLGLYAGCQPSRTPQVLAVLRSELARMAEDGISPEELARARGQLRGSLVLGMEDTGSRMGRLGKAELVYGELPTIDELLQRIDAVTVQDVLQLAQQLLPAAPTVAAIGPFAGDDILLAG